MDFPKLIVQLWFSLVAFLWRHGRGLLAAVLATFAAWALPAEHIMVDIFDRIPAAEHGWEFVMPWLNYSQAWFDVVYLLRALQIYFNFLFVSIVIKISFKFAPWVG